MNPEDIDKLFNSDVFITEGPAMGLVGRLQFINFLSMKGYFVEHSTGQSAWVDLRYIGIVVHDEDCDCDLPGGRSAVATLERDEDPLAVKQLSDEETGDKYNLVWPGEKPGVRVVINEGVHVGEAGTFIGVNEILTEKVGEEIINVQLDDGSLQSIARRSIQSSVYQGEEN